MYDRGFRGQIPFCSFGLLCEWRMSLLMSLACMSSVAAGRASVEPEGNSGVFRAILLSYFNIPTLLKSSKSYCKVLLNVLSTRSARITDSTSNNKSRSLIHIEDL